MTNLLIIDCHDLGQHLGCYGQASVTSPNIDQLAQEGIRFDNSFCTAPQCSPSRAALYTGRYGHSNGMFGLAHHPFSWRLHDDEIYLAKYLQNAGYETAHVGIQHVTDWNDEAVKKLGFDHVLPGHLAPEVADSAVQFLQREHEQPFFLNIGFFEPHRDDAGGFKVAPPDNARGVELPPYIPDTDDARQEFTELQGMITQMDAAVGTIVAALKRLNLFAETWIIFTTDHGLAMPRAKCTMYDPGVETALIMHVPGLTLSGGQVYKGLVSHVDVVPTVLEGSGLNIPERLQGQSYWNTLNRHTEPNRTEIFASKTFHTDYEPQRMVRTARYKLIWNAEVDIINVPADIMHSPIYSHMIDMLTVERSPFELYDLENDPNETENLAGQADYAAIQDDLRAKLLRWMQETDDPILEGPIASPYYSRAMHQLRGKPTE